MSAHSADLSSTLQANGINMYAVVKNWSHTVPHSF
jgi:hypothetical protein